MSTGPVRLGVGEHIPDPPPWGQAPEQATVWPTPPQADLLRATLLADERAVAAWQRIRPLLRASEMDYATQALVPQLRRNLLALGIEDELLPLFKGVHRYTWARNQLLISEALPVIAALEGAGVQTLLLKGAALVADRRQDAGMRKMTDVDLLVPTDALAKACSILTAAGMKPSDGSPIWWVTDYAPSFKVSVNFTNAAGGQLDLHWHVLRDSCAAGADQEFWSAAVPIELQGVATRALCAADELLLLIAHGLTWAGSPTYRWILDATLVTRGLCGPVDYERLVSQARRHRLAPIVRSGLRYLKRNYGAEVPDATLAALRVTAPWQRLELRARTIRPGRRGAIERAAVVHGQYLRHRVPVGRRVTPAVHLRLARARLGIEGPGDLLHLRSGGRPGPGRPYLGTTAPLGTGACAPPPLRWNAPLEFSQPSVVREHAVYGLCYPEDTGCCIAGREACVALSWPGAVSSSLILELNAWGLVHEHRPRQRLEVLVGAEQLGCITFDADRRRVDPEAFVLPARLVTDRTCLEIVFRAPDARPGTRWGINDDARPIGVVIERLRLRPPRACSAGQPLAFGTDSGDERMLGGGWAWEAEPGGRWTYGPAARLLLAPDSTATTLEWHADPFVPPGAPPLQVEVSANGQMLGTVEVAADESRIRLPLRARAAHGELLLSWRIRNPRRPSDYLPSEDRRPLGLFFRTVTLLA